MLGNSNDVKKSFGYNGEKLDESGNIYLRARYYNPRIGQFVQIDRYRGESNDVESQNRYLYCLNNPYKYVDRDGKSITLALISAAAAVVTYCAVDYTIKNAGTISKFISKAGQVIGNGLKKVGDTLLGIGKAVIGAVTAGTVGNNTSNNGKDFVDFVDDCLNYFPNIGLNDLASDALSAVNQLGLVAAYSNLSESTW